MDMRLGFNGLYALVVGQLKQDPQSGHPQGRVVRYLDSELSARKAGASGSESRIPDRHGQNIWGIAIGRKN
jgi:hypothetical protein